MEGEVECVAHPAHGVTEGVKITDTHVALYPCMHSLSHNNAPTSSTNSFIEISGRLWMR